MKVKMCLFACLVVCVGLGGAAHAELLINGDFEAGLGGWWAWGSGSGSGTGGYKWWSGAATTASPGGSDGGEYAVLDTMGMNGHMDSWGWVWQGVGQNEHPPATEGETITVEGYAKVLNPGGPLHVWYGWENASGNRVDYDGDGVWGEGNPDNNDDRTHLMIDLAGGGSWEYFTQDTLVPTGLTGGPITQFDFLVSIEAAPYAIAIDQLSVVPEPATMALLGIGGLLMLRRRRA